MQQRFYCTLILWSWTSNEYEIYYRTDRELLATFKRRIRSVLSGKQTKQKRIFSLYDILNFDGKSIICCEIKR